MAEAAEFAKQQAKRAEENNKLVKNMSGTMDKRLSAASTAQKLLKEYDANQKIIILKINLVFILKNEKTI